MSNEFLPVSAPTLDGREKEYVMECLDTTWISSNGKFIRKFEQSFAEYCRTDFAVACCNGTVALHLALLALDVGPGDEVIVPTLTYVATANAVRYVGATPVFADSRDGTWNADPASIERAVTSKTKAIIVVHLYGHPADMNEIGAIASRHNLRIIEDAAEAHGADYHGRRVGSIGDIATFSFYGNKIITTGEGGMVLTRSPELRDRVRMLCGQGQDPKRRYWFPIVGYNYRMTNIEAAIGLAQLERVEHHIARRREVAMLYADYLRGAPNLVLPCEDAGVRHVFWMYSVLVRGADAATRDRVMHDLFDAGIETRPLFYPMHHLPPHAPFAAGRTFPMADRIAASGMNLPTWGGMTKQDVRRVCDALLRATSALAA